jgi:hypothetical protein
MIVATHFVRIDTKATFFIKQRQQSVLSSLDCRFSKCPSKWLMRTFKFFIPSFPWLHQKQAMIMKNGTK